MTSATVTQLGDMMAGISNNIGNMETQNGEFAEIFQTAAEKSEGTVKQEATPVKTSATENTMSVSKKADELKNAQTEVQTAEPEDADAVEKELESAVEELKTEIAEKLDITVEELETVMETLGLTDASLFTQEGMTALVMEIEQISTPVELLTNADAYQNLQELNAFANELLGNVQEELQLTDKQMQMALEQFEESEKAVQALVTGETELPLATKEVGASETQQVKEVTETEAEAETVTTKTEERSTVTEEQTISDEGTTVKESEPVKTENGAESKENGQQHAGTNNQAVAENSFQQSNVQTVNQMTDLSQNITGGNLNTQEIYDQIGEYIKTNIRPGISELEMQLNPENLGTLHIHLSSKQGNVTAQLTVQNELVKAALEVQLIQLKENFAEQGIKVDAVEVTVESHAFNQNMQQGNEENEQAQAQAKRTTTRSINLNDGWEEELTEEEQLVAEMMEADGNTVDYKA